MSTTTTTTTKTYYTDSTGPSTTLGVLSTGLAPFGSKTQPRVQYALYEDSATFTAWYAWAKQNAYDSNAMTKFSSRALKLYGFWDTMAKDDLSLMCIEDRSTSNAKGALCAEAYLTEVSGTTVYDSKTYSIKAADTATKLPTSLNPSSSVKSLDMTGTSYGSPAATYVPVSTGTTSTPSAWKSFSVFNCTVNTVSMKCHNWVAAAGKEADGGYPRWFEGQSVRFWWFDGRDLSNTSNYPVSSFEKVKYQDVTLTFDNTSSGALQMASLLAFVPITLMLAF